MHMDMLHEYCIDASVSHDMFALDPQDLSVLFAASKATPSLGSTQVILVKMKHGNHTVARGGGEPCMTRPHNVAPAVPRVW